jgi:phage tail sheath protein FI
MKKFVIIMLILYLCDAQKTDSLFVGELSKSYVEGCSGSFKRLLIELKGYIGQISQTLVFEQNTAATRNNFLSQVNPYLESVQQRQGLYAFKVVMDDSNNTPDVIDRNQLVGQIFLQPTKTAEFIILDFNVLPTGATFPA